MTVSSAPLLARGLEVLALADASARQRLVAVLALVTRQVRFVSDARGLMVHLWQQPPDVIIITWVAQAHALPELCGQVRQFLQTPLLILEEGATEGERISWLDSGADDVLALASSTPAELGARCAALLRRVQRQRRRDPATMRLHALGLQLDVVGRRLYAPDGQMRDLSPGQLRLLALLFRHNGGVVSREALAEHMAGTASLTTQRRVTWLVRSLNQHLAGLRPRPCIESLHGRGYRLTLAG